MTIASNSNNAVTLQAGSFGNALSLIGDVGGLVTSTNSGYGIDATLSPATLASYFLTDSGELYANAVTGSVVKEIATNATTTDKTGYSLAADGLDAVVVEAGLNARQALSLGTAALVGVLSGAATTSVTILGAGVGTTRVVATVTANGDRTAVSLSPPA